MNCRVFALRGLMALLVLFHLASPLLAYSATVDAMRKSFAFFVDFQREVKAAEIVRLLGQPDSTGVESFFPDQVKYTYHNGPCELYFQVDKKTQKVKSHGFSTDQNDKICGFGKAREQAEYARNQQKFGPQVAQFMRLRDSLEISGMSESLLIQKLGKPSSVKAASKPKGEREIRYNVGKCVFSFPSDANQKMTGASGYFCAD